MNQFTRYEISDHLAVELARKYSEELGEPILVSVGSNPGYDMMTQSQDLKYEIKKENKTLSSGNLAIEIFNRKYQCKSGIESTEANVWLHLCLTPEGYLCLEMDVEKLREIAMQYGKNTNCAYNSVCMIVPLEIIKKHCRRMFIFDTKFYKELGGE